ncbi:hypothetical protein J3R83DRAFT_153 [Lanmaoa asiatica]|nr:hypothetical protein J3R83DRAFT_153 [Lanmaoa asiatica]
MRYSHSGYARSFNFIGWFIDNTLKLLTVRNLEMTKEPLTIARIDVAQPGADQIPAIPMIPKTTIPMERLIPSKGNGKLNKACDSSKMTLQYTKASQPTAGQFSDVSYKPPTASPKKAWPGAGLPSAAAEASQADCYRQRGDHIHQSC